MTLPTGPHSLQLHWPPKTFSKHPGYLLSRDFFVYMPFSHSTALVFKRLVCLPHFIISSNLSTQKPPWLCDLSPEHLFTVLPFLSHSCPWHFPLAICVSQNILLLIPLIIVLFLTNVTSEYLKRLRKFLAHDESIHSESMNGLIYSIGMLFLANGSHQSISDDGK